MAEQVDTSTIETMITELARAIQIFKYYGEDHPATKDTINKLDTQVQHLLTRQNSIIIGILGDELLFDKEPLYDLSQKRQGFIRHLKQLGVKKIRFNHGVDKREINQFIQLLCTNPETIDPEAGIQPIAESYQFSHIRFGDLGFQVQEEVEEYHQERLESILDKNIDSKVKFLTENYNSLKGQQQLNVHSAKQIVEGLISNFIKNKNLLLMLTSLKSHDENTFEHGVNVAIYTMMQAEILGLEPKHLVDVGVAAMLHDIGKITATPDDIDTGFVWDPDASNADSKLSKLKELDQDVKGAKILLDTEEIGVLPAIVAFEHNMNYDFSGPQRKVYGKDLNLISMIISVSDYYDKLRRETWFYEDKGPERAYEEMMNLSGIKFQPDILQNFFSVIGIYPPGTLVELDSHEVAMVVQGSVFDLYRPQVEILYDKDGNKLDTPKIVNLVEKDRRGKFKRSIVKSISPRKKTNDAMSHS